MARPAALAAVLAVLSATGCGRMDHTIDLELNGHTIQAEVAATPEARGRGLMLRSSLSEHGGMLFVFPVATKQCMWMKDTAIPLSVAFLDDAGRILNIAEMAAQDPAFHCSTGPARYAVEMNTGWFDRHGGRAGIRVSGLAAAPTPE